MGVDLRNQLIFSGENEFGGEFFEIFFVFLFVDGIELAHKYTLSDRLNEHQVGETRGIRTPQKSSK